MQRRLTDAEREMVSNFLKSHMTLADCGLEVSPLLATKMLVHNTTDGLPFVESPLTDDDARQRPWVMVRDNEAEPWRGPRALAACCGGDYYTFTPSVCGIIGFRYARRATAAEIAAAGLEVAE